MRIFHISDLHIGKLLNDRNLAEDQEYIFNQIIEIAEERQPQVILIAGDIYQTSTPGAEATRLFDGFITGMLEKLPNVKIMAVSGNHDNGSKVDYLNSLLVSNGVYMVGRPPQLEDEFIKKIVLEDEFGKINFYLLPFVKPGMVKQITGVSEDGRNLSYDEAISKLIEREDINRQERNVLVSHQYYLPMGKTDSEVEKSEGEYHSVGGVDSVNCKVLEAFDYVALGHIHKPMTVISGKAYYSGTPLAYNMDEAGQKKRILQIDIGEKNADIAVGNVGNSADPAVENAEEEDLNLKIESVELQPLRKVRKIKGYSLEEIERYYKENPQDGGKNDYVILELDKKDDEYIFNLQKKLKSIYPNILKYSYKKREKAGGKTREEVKYEEFINAGPMEMCEKFITDMTEEERELLKSIINEAQEELVGEIL